jgi:hypothetical protein
VLVGEVDGDATPGLPDPEEGVDHVGIELDPPTRDDRLDDLSCGRAPSVSFDSRRRWPPE